MFDVATRRLPPPGAGSHVAAESPCQLRGPGDAATAPGAKWKRRVCVPASVSIFSVSASCHVMCSRPGTLMMLPAPYDLHWLPARSSAAGSHALMIDRAARDEGMRRYSPLAGVTIRYRPFSVTYDTQ